MAEKGGQPGNKNAVKETRMVTSALKRAAAQNPDKLREACEKVIEEAANGNLAAFNVLADRLDGKPTQEVQGSVSHDHKHSVESIPETNSWLVGLLADGKDSKDKKPLPN